MTEKITKANYQIKKLRSDTPNLWKYLDGVIKLRNKNVVPKGQEPTEDQKKYGFLSPIPLFGNTSKASFWTYLHAPKQAHRFITIAINDKDEVIAYRTAPNKIPRLFQALGKLSCDLVPIKVKYYLDMLKGVYRHSKENNLKNAWITGEACVAREHRSQGIMRKMVERENDFLKNVNADCLYVIHDKQNGKSKDFQTKRGFRQDPVAELHLKDCSDVLRAKILN